ncbi:MAG: 30S ribosomal protein THX [Saprospiraceae bacterium]|nr:30S ribosomal protein THX [Saprospiraceae bacterium]
MGKGDIKTRRGKIHNGSYGKSRPHSKPVKPQSSSEPAKKTAKKTAKKKPARAKKKA